MPEDNTVAEPERTLEYIITHVFAPLRIPEGGHYTAPNDYALAEAVCHAAQAFSEHVGAAEKALWDTIRKMLDNLRVSVSLESLPAGEVASQLKNMKTGDILAFLIREQNAAVIFRKGPEVTTYEAIEVSPTANAVMAARGRIICSYPGPAIEIPNAVFNKQAFQLELANFLAHMNEDFLRSPSLVSERETCHPQGITELLTGILRALGRPAEVARITKRIGDDVIRSQTHSPWRRSSLWLLIRVALQTSLERSPLGRVGYKSFIVFFMCSLAEKTQREDLSNDLIHSVSTKISRRLRKLGSPPDWLSSTALQACSLLRSLLEERWMDVQAVQHIPLASWDPFDLDLARDVELMLEKSREYIRNVLANPGIDSIDPNFEPAHHPRGALAHFLDSDGVFFDTAYKADRHIALYDVEKAVEQELDAWVEGVDEIDDACVRLEILANKYSSRARTAYANDPEHLSIMLLTTIELWIALDKLVVWDIPFFAEYSPEVPTSILQNLLVRKAASLERVRRAFEYLSNRHSKSSRGWSVFSNEITPDSFSIRYFNEPDSHLPDLKGAIEAAAQRRRNLKVAELEKANALHAELTRQASRLEHTYTINRRGNQSHVKKQCQKCRLTDETAYMYIQVDEWPLPDEDLKAANVVFELDCPISFNMWRSATFHLLLDLCSPPPEIRRAATRLDQYGVLLPNLVNHPRARITLGSHSKPVISTNGGSKSIPSTEEKVCIENTLSFYYYDTQAQAPTLEAFSKVDLTELCTYKLPNGPYHNLQQYVSGTTHTSNEVIADQAICHKDLSIHEFISFGHLRSGGGLQWMNILRELRDRALNFRRPEVHFLLAQAASQIGQFTKEGKLFWHLELQDTFCEVLLSELEGLVGDVEANWLEGATMGTISFLLGRMLASEPDEDISERALELLRTVRKKTYGWVLELSEKVASASNPEEHRHLLRDTAAICRSTFDVDPCDIRTVLHSAEDVEPLVACAIFIHDNTPAELTTLSAYSQLLLVRDRRLSLALENVMQEVVDMDYAAEGVDLAICKVWPGYRVGSEWGSLEPPNARWLWCATEATTTQCSQLVHLNLLDGTLLVDGKPLSRLPAPIMQHQLYRLLFGERVFDVTPSDIPGMTFSTRGLIEHHQLHFSLRDQDLIIRAKREDKEDILELIPQDKLGQDLPAVLIQGHAHWLNLSTSIIEVRPIGKLWESSPENWELDCTPGKYRMRKGRDRLIDIRSPTWEMVAGLLEPLDHPGNILVTVALITSPENERSRQLSVTLPRYSLSFFVNEAGELESRNLRNMVYDQNQSIDTLFGLVNQLVLRPKNQLEPDLFPRCVLVPDGNVAFGMRGHHVRVEIDIHSPPRRPVTYQTYRVDSELGCLTGSGSLTSKLFLAYLHALTSGGCNIDPLTGRTGTEEALSLLRSAGCRSIMKVDARDAHLLRLIASLCPARKGHSKELGQNVHWQSLPETSQHHDLYTVATEIKNHCERIQFFNPNSDPKLFEEFPTRDSELFQRSALRAAYLFPSDPRANPQTTDHDIVYASRDVFDSKRRAREYRAYTAAHAVYHKSTKMASRIDVLELMKEWSSPIKGTARLSLRYNKHWLTRDLPSIWMEVYNQSRKSNGDKQFQLLFSLSAMAYGHPNLITIVPVFVAFATCPQFQHLNPPQFDTFSLSKGYEPSESVLEDEITEQAFPFDLSPECSILEKPGESLRDLTKRRDILYQRRLHSDIDSSVQLLTKSWPTQHPPALSLKSNSYHLELLNASIANQFSNWYRNRKLIEHIRHVQAVLDEAYKQGVTAPPQEYVFKAATGVPPRTPWTLTPELLFARPVRLLGPCATMASHDTDVKLEEHSSEPTPLDNLISEINAKATNSLQRQYLTDLQASAEHFARDSPLAASRVTERPPTEALRKQYADCRLSYLEALEDIRQKLGPARKNSSQQALVKSGHWPRITPDSLFRLLASAATVRLPTVWKKNITTLATLALNLQRARRLLRLDLDNLHEEFMKESENRGFDGWDATTYPDWLLIQLQGNFLVRRVQVDVALQMISPESGENTTMQLNMGEGKSSVIVPITVAVLAGGTQMVRVIVPKALTGQMFHLLVDRLSGLVNRRIYYLPFSRSLGLDSEQAAALHDIMAECMRNRGVLLVQPEHVLSLKLVSVEKQLSEPQESPLARNLLKLQRWIQSHVRDVLDESDEILHVRYQLVYTLGLQQPMEGFPERWTTTQQVLGLVKKYAASLRETFPLGVEYEGGPSGSFPHFRILQGEVGKMLIEKLVQDTIESVLPNFQFEHLPADLKNAISVFISSRDVADSIFDKVEMYARNSTLWLGLLLLRGLFASDILLFAFKQRRWRVDYGLAPERTMLAVPYRAKDVPAQRAEFGHPDVAILLTCLSYYYGGLNDEQLNVCFDLLLKQEDPSLDYDLWVQGCPSIPDFLRSFSGINIKSKEQWQTFLLPLFSRNQATVDFYLSRVVFPKEAKEFPSKLCCSGWDLAEKKEQLTTGFSGTNDGRYLLPISITQRDPEHQRGTNAKVLTYLLQSENDRYRLTTYENGERRNTHEFLEMVVAQTPEIRVLLDVGAQMLDLQNRQLAEAWLDLSPDTSAAIYFNDEDELIVLTRDGRIQPLLSSPFAQQLDQCVIYLDDAHTRGTDIKFPRGFRAAVTLGPKVTKDRLAQGCMRMRKLGHGHSLMFFAPLEIDRSIRAVTGKGPSDEIRAMDILQWAIHETCNEIQVRAPQWAQQGIDHTSRFRLWARYCARSIVAAQLKEGWLQPEAKTLADLYSPQNTFDSSSLTVPEIRERCERLGVVSLRDLGMDEEQEREVVHEIERERQVERPPKASPATHSVHPDVQTFVTRGSFPRRTKALIPFIQVLTPTSAAPPEPRVWTPFLWASADFSTTVAEKSGKKDDYLRPVHWLLSGKQGGHKILVILSPQEVDTLLPDIRVSQHVSLHIYVARTIKSMKPCDDLRLYSIPDVPLDWTPPWALIDQLNIFAGQLYLRDHSAYLRICRFLCVYANDPEGGEHVEITSDGFIAPANRPPYMERKKDSSFQSSPLPFLRVLLGLRRKGMRFATTHMGKILDGRLLSSRDLDNDVMDDSDAMDVDSDNAMLL